MTATSITTTSISTTTITTTSPICIRDIGNDLRTQEIGWFIQASESSDKVVPVSGKNRCSHPDRNHATQLTSCMGDQPGPKDLDADSRGFYGRSLSFVRLSLRFLGLLPPLLWGEDGGRVDFHGFLGRISESLESKEPLGWASSGAFCGAQCHETSRHGFQL